MVEGEERANSGHSSGRATTGHYHCDARWFSDEALAKRRVHGASVFAISTAGPSPGEDPGEDPGVGREADVAVLRRAQFELAHAREEGVGAIAGGYH